MKTTTALLGLAALAGIGYCIGKKLAEKKCNEVYEEDEEDDSCYCCETKFDNKLHKASMFAVGAIKTGADKVAEGIGDIMNKDNKDNIVKKGEETYENAKEAIVKKSEETFESAKEATENIKKEINELKNLAVSINKKSDSETEEETTSEDTADADVSVDLTAEETADIPAEEESDDLVPSVDENKKDAVSGIDFTFGEESDEGDDGMDTI